MSRVPNIRRSWRVVELSEGLDLGRRDVVLLTNSRRMTRLWSFWEKKEASQKDWSFQRISWRLTRVRSCMSVVRAFDDGSRMIGG